MTATEIEIWGRPLEKMTTKDLKEIALQVPEISGVHGMRKEQLVEALRTSKGIEVPKAKKAGATLGALKKRIRAAKSRRQEALEAKDRKAAAIFRRRVARLKKLSRRAAG
ncbi:MAG: transcription termination factor Rho [Desulfobacterales bacterium]|jgi:hypothetical protein|nr:transcription termination factor Rho [Desulfobacterales bacterium]